MKIYDPDSKRTLKNVSLFLTADEAADLGLSATDLSESPEKHHHHVSDVEYNTEITVSVYTEFMGQFRSSPISESPSGKPVKCGLGVSPTKSMDYQKACKNAPFTVLIPQNLPARFAVSGPPMSLPGHTVQRWVRRQSG